MSEDVRRWIETSPYTRCLGVELEALGGGRVRLALPYREENSNPGRVLHGGVAASLGVVGAHALARAALGEGACPFHACAVQVSYLAAAVGEAVVAEGRLLRQGKELCFAAIEVATADGKPIAQISAAVRGRFGAPPAALEKSQGDDSRAEPGPMGGSVGRVSFIGNRGIKIEHMRDGRARLRMPALPERNADSGGGVHEGALLALLDTAGAMGAWAATGPGPYKASTPAIQAQVIEPQAEGELVAFAHVAQRDAELFVVPVEVARAHDLGIVARGTAIYRIIT